MINNEDDHVDEKRSSSKRVTIDAEQLEVGYKLLEFELVNSYSKLYKKFKRTEYRTTFNIKHNLAEYSNLAILKLEWEENMENIIKHYFDLENAKEDDFFGITIKFPTLENPIYISPKKVSNFNVDQIFSLIEKFAQSNKALLADGLIDIGIIITKNLKRGG